MNTYKCPQCNADLDEQDVICIKCGFMINTNSSINTQFEGEGSKKLPTYAGLNRKNYFLYTLFINLGILVISSLLITFLKFKAILPILAIYAFGSLLLFGATLGRIQNMGSSGKAIWGMLVPFYNAWYFVRLLSDPPGYDMHKELDGYAKKARFLFPFYIIISLYFSYFPLVEKVSLWNIVKSWFKSVV